MLSGPLPVADCRRPQIGEFYETSGWDAVLMVEHCGLNPMGDRRPPQAGFRAAALERTLQDLQLKGLDVVRRPPT